MSCLGIDLSTKSIAFCSYDGKPDVYGKIYISGENIYERIYDAKRKAEALAAICPEPNLIAIESPVMVKSSHVTIKLSMITGAVISGFMKNKVKVVSVAPVTWQSYIGNKVFSKMEKEDLAAQYPNRTRAWYSGKMREVRKQRTIDFFSQHFKTNNQDDDVADSMGIAYYGYKGVVLGG